MKIHPLVLFLVMAVCMGIGNWLERNIYDWPAIYANLERLEELEERAAVYDTMAEAHVGAWCQLAVHYDWLEESDKQQAAEIINSEVHKKEKEDGKKEL